MEKLLINIHDERYIPARKAPIGDRLSMLFPHKANPSCIESLSSITRDYTKNMPKYAVEDPNQERVLGNLTWRQQRGGTCVTFAVANAATSLGMKLGWKDIKHFYGNGQFSKVVDVVANHITPFDVVQSTENINGKAHPRYVMGKKFDSIDPITQEDVEHNAHILKGFLDRNIVPLVSVDANELFPLLEGKREINFNIHSDRHAIPIVGYRVNNEGHMNVLLLESNFGPMWVPLEFLTQIINADRNTYLVYGQNKSK